MKNLNLFRKSARGSEGSTLASTIVRPSFDRRSTVVKHLAFMLLFLLGSLNVWGETVTFSDLYSANTVLDGTAVEVTPGVTATFNKREGGTATQYYTKGQAVRWYGGGTLVVTSTVGNITAINITFTQTANSISTDCGTYDNGSWTGDAASVTFTQSGTSGHCRISAIEVTYTTGGGSTPSLSVSPTVIDFGTVDKDASVEAQEVTVTYENLTGAVAYSGLSGAFTASGTIAASGNKITITPNTANTGNFQQTLTVQSEADSKSAEVTVKMNVVEPFDGKKLTFDVSSNPGEWPTANDASLTNYTYTLNAEDYTFALKNIKCNSGYLMMTATAVLGLPAIEGYKLVKVEATNSSSCSTSTQVKITSDEAGDEVVSGGAAQTFSTTSTKYTYTLSDTEENTMYYLIATNKNCQLVTLVLYYEEATPSIPKAIKPTFIGDETFLNSTSVSLSTTTEGASIYYTMGDAPADPTASSTLYEGPINVTATTTIKAIAVKAGMDNSPVATATFTKITPKTVAEAIAAIPNKNDAVDNQYVAGIVCTEGASVNASGQMTYYISDDGSVTNKLQIYKGKNLNNTEFSSVSDLAIGDRVVVFGQLKNFNNTPEMNDGNYLVFKEGPAVATPVFTPDGGGFMGETDVTITCATDGNAIYYTLDNTTPSKSSTPYTAAIHINATTTIKAIAYVGEESSLVVEKTFTLTAPKTVAEALSALDSQDPINNVAVRGIISTAPTSNPSSGRLTYRISDDGEATNELEVFNGYGLNGASFSSKTDLQVGDEVTVFGNLTIYTNTSTKEFSAGSRLLTFNRPTVDLESIALPATANVKTGKTITLTPIFTPVNATDKEVSWSSDAESVATVVGGVVTGVTAGTANITVTYNADPTIKATCKVTVAEAITFNDPNHEWQLVTSDAQLVAGKYYVMASTAQGKVAGAISNDILGTVDATIADGAIAYNAFGTDQTADAASAVVFELGGTTGAWTLNEAIDELGQLAYKGNKTVKWETESTAAWAITIADNNATLVPAAANTYHMLYNVSSPRFTIYTSDPAANMLLPQLYVWAEKTYKLRYDANGGENAPAAQAADGEGKATVTDAKPTKEDYIFKEWNTLVGGDGEAKAAGDVIDLSAGDVTLYAQWREPNTYSISYNANGGTVISGETALDPENVTEGNSYTVKANVYELEGKIFMGWKAADVIYNAGQVIHPTEDMAFVAQWGNPNVTDFMLVTDVKQLKDGDKVYIVADGNYNVALGELNGSVRNPVEIAKSNAHIVNIGNNPVELTLGKDGNDYTFYDGANYLAWSSGNTLTNASSVSDKSTWNITISEGVTKIANKDDGTREIRYNSGSPRFAAYAGTQQHVSIYKRPDYSRDVTEGRYGTICLPKAGKIEGVELYEVAYKDLSQNKIFFDQIVNGEMIAGRPYVFLPKAGTAQLAVYYTDNTAVDAAAEHYNGLYGFIGADPTDEFTIPQSEGYYIIQNNQYREVQDGVAKIVSNRAYLKMSEIPGTAYTPLPGRKRMSIGAAAPAVATGVDQVLSDQVPNTKVLINGQLFILRGEKMYDAKGQLVK